jgi:hypothetical protein
MKLFEGKTSWERGKILAALALPLVALILVFRMFFASDTPHPTNRNTNRNSNRSAATAPANGAQTADGDGEIAMPEPVQSVITASYAPEPARNIFAFYVKPTPSPGTATPVETPTPTPTPPPPLTLGSLQPTNVYARTGDFALEVTGDKFTPQTHVFVDGQELPTTFKSAQQLSATIPAAFVQSPGARAVVVRTPDNTLYSNTQTVNVMPPPTPQFSFIGILGTKHYSDDKAILKPSTGSNDLLTVKRGDIVGGRFKVVSISDRAVDFIDTQLSIKHSIPYSDKGVTGGVAPRVSQPQQADDDDGEP